MKEKVPFYEFANMFFSGASFSVLLVFLFYDYPGFFKKFIEIISPLKDWTVVVSAALLVAMYEIGFILNKTSSVLLGRLLEHSKIWPREKYGISVSQLEEKVPKFRSLNIELHVTRTHIVMYLILFGVSMFLRKWFVGIVFLAIAILLLFAGKITNSFMNKIKSDYNSTEDNKSDG